MGTKGAGPPCEVTNGCPVTSAVQISIAGTYADKGPPVNACKRHRGIIIDLYCAISNDVRVRRSV